jgi:L-ascorbate metabolism protein UlaG (beta-lactamase superfamily)
MTSLIVQTVSQYSGLWEPAHWRNSRKRAKIVTCVLAVMAMASPLLAQNVFEKDTIQTTAGALEITFIGHGTLMMTWNGKTIHVDPYSKLADYSQLPKADLVLITHHHGDHLDTKAMDIVCTDKTVILLTKICAEQVGKGIVMMNGDARTVLGIKIEAVPAYNLVHKRPDGNPFHPKGEGNGYVFTFGTTRVYVAGDTENTPEMKALKDIDVAFIPMNLPYTMTPKQVADAAKAFRPKVLYPYHYGETDPGALAGFLKGEKGIEVRIRKMR